MPVTNTDTSPLERNFTNRTDESARVLIWFAPAGIEEMFSKMARDPDRYVEIGAEYGVNFPESEG